jgi:acetyl esterase/lipase
VSTLGAILLLFTGVLGLLGVWNAAKPIGDPTRRYSPWWLPAMVIVELAPFWLLAAVTALMLGVLIGGFDNPAGQVGGLLLVVTSSVLVYLIVRSVLAVRRVRPLVEGVVQPPRGIAALVGRPVTTPPGVVEQHGIEWRPGLTLDLARPAPGGAGTLPVLLYVHGGGWTNGDPQRQARDLYHTLALAGWAVAAVRYPFTPGASVEQQVEAIRDAVRWARTGLREHGITAERVVLAGGSAGGHLATMAALTATDPDEWVDACVGIYAIYDLANRTPTRAHWTKIDNEVMLATVEEAPDRYRALSPLDRIHVASPPRHARHVGADRRRHPVRRCPASSRAPGRLRPRPRRPARVRRRQLDHQPHRRRRDPRLADPSGAYCVIAAVDVDDLAGGRGEPVAEQRAARLGDR